MICAIVAALTMAIAFGGATSACSDTGAVHVDMRMPSAATLSPASLDPAEITLFYWEPGAPATAVASELGSAPMALAEVAPGSQLYMALTLRSAVGRLLGYGRSAAPITILDGDNTEVAIEMRRPFVYLGSERGLSALDTTRDGTDTESAISLVNPVDIAVSSYDGTRLVALTTDVNGNGWAHVIRTSDHRVISPNAISLAGPAADLVITADGGHAVVAHSGVNGGVSIIDIDAAVRGEAEVEFVPLGPIGKVTISPYDNEIVYALGDVLEDVRCSDNPESWIAALSIPSAEPVIDTFIYSGAVADIAAADIGEPLLVADTCSGQVREVDLLSGEIRNLAPLYRVTSLAYWNRRVWAVGSLPVADSGQANGAEPLRIMSLSLDQPGYQFTEIDALSVQVSLEDFRNDGDEVFIDVSADGMFALDLAVMPTGEAAAVLLRGDYLADSRRDMSGNIITPAMEISTSEYLLVDVGKGTLIQRVIHRCDLRLVDPNSIITNLSCQKGANAPLESPGGSGNEHAPSAISVLLGSR